MSSRSDLTHEDVVRILRIVDEATDVAVTVELDGLKLRVEKGMAGRAAAVSEAPSLGGGAVPPGEAAPPAPVAGPAAPSAAPVPTAEEATAPQGAAAPAAAEGTVVVRAPVLGRFFRASSPTEPPYAEVGSKVGPDDTLCIVEVMKLFNPVKAGVSGTVVEILVRNDEMVEHDQPLFVIQPN